MAAEVKSTPLPAFNATSTLARDMRKLLAIGTVTLFAILLLIAYLMPMVYAASTSLNEENIEVDAPLWPATPATFTYAGESYDIYLVPTEQGVRRLALYRPGREDSTFLDPANPSQPIEWQGRWRALDRAWAFQPRWGNYAQAYDQIDFGRLFLNTILITLLGTIGTVISSTLVAYGFSRFRIPGGRVLFMILIATIILPPQVTFIPTYIIFTRLGWTGTWLPLIIPHFFANAYNVFLLRQFFMGIPRDMDEAAMIDGASPFRTLISVILPQAVPALVAVAMFHFFWSWNDFFGPLIYLTGKPDLYPISVGMQAFNALYATQRHLVQATAIMAMAAPLLIFLFSQRAFMQGVVVTGVEK